MLIFFDKVQKSIWGPVKWQVISAILILFNVYGFSNKSSPEIIKLSLNPFITNAPSVSDGQCETKNTVQLVDFLKKVANTMSTLIGKPGKLIRIFSENSSRPFKIFFLNSSSWVWPDILQKLNEGTHKIFMDGFSRNWFMLRSGKLKFRKIFWMNFPGFANNCQDTKIPTRTSKLFRSVWLKRYWVQWLYMKNKTVSWEMMGCTASEGFSSS